MTFLDFEVLKARVLLRMHFKSFDSHQDVMLELDVVNESLSMWQKVASTSHFCTFWRHQLTIKIS